MASQLQARILDIKITGKTPKTITYDLTRNGQSEQWKIPSSSTFDTKQLVIGQRYIVTTTVLKVKAYCHVARKTISKERYDWVTVREPVPAAKLEARTAKQRALDEQTAAMPLVGPDLFGW